MSSRIRIVRNVEPKPIKVELQHAFSRKSNGETSKSKITNSNDAYLIHLLVDAMKNILNNRENDYTDHINGDNYSHQHFQIENKSLIRENQCENQGLFTTIMISNQKSIEQSKFGEKFSNSLDSRDKMLVHPFKFHFKVLSPENYSNSHQTSFMFEKTINEKNQESYQESQSYKHLCNSIQEYIVDVVENVLSISFNLLSEGKLKENQCKDYASKNILINIRSIFKEVMKTLTKEKLIDEHQKEKLRYSLCELINSTLKSSISNIIAYYPQSPPTGGTPLMKKTLLSIDRNDNQELDFLYTQNLRLIEQESGNYTQFIMRVVNRATLVANESDKDDPSQITLFHKFVAFSENLFWMTQQNQYDEIIQNLEQQTSVANNSNLQSKPQDINEQNHQKSIKISRQNQQIAQKQKLAIQQYMRKPVFPQFENAMLYNEIKKNQNKRQNKLKKVEKAEKVEKDNIRNSGQGINEGKKKQKIEKMKEKHDFLIGQKIPSHVKTFSQKDLMNKNFSSKNSAVLRMLTKWAENLQSTFDNAQTYTKNRIYPFKTMSHQITYLPEKFREQLFKQILIRKKEKQKYNKKLITQNKEFQSAFLAKDTHQNLSKFIKRYTQTRVIASKMSALLAQVMKEYVSFLINLLVEAGKLRIENESYDINLITFKIGDLMRSKIYCNEESFVCLLKTLYILDETNGKRNKKSDEIQSTKIEKSQKQNQLKIKKKDEININEDEDKKSNQKPNKANDKVNKKPLFQLVRIKNKLDTKDNNILINYLFMGKVQCELQMSVQRMATKEQNYNNFNHFLYELIRGKFGVLAQCATIISQQDPIISASASDHYYQPKNFQKKQVHLKKKMQKNKKQNIEKQKIENIKQRSKKEKEKNQIFICKQCENLKFGENINLLKRKQKQQSICNDCLIQNSMKLKKRKFSNQQEKQSHQQKQHPAEKKLKDTNMGDWLVESLKNGQITKLINYAQLQGQKLSVIFSLNQTINDLQYSIYSKQQSQEICFLSPITKDLWLNDQIKEDKIHYEDITAKIKDGKMVPQYTYIASFTQKKSCVNSLQKIQFLQIDTIEDKLIELDEKCQQKILRDCISNLLKNKNQSLQFSSNNKKLAQMEKYCNSNVTWVNESLSYIKFICAVSMKNQGDQQAQQLKDESNTQINSIDWKKYQNLQRLNISQNNIKQFQVTKLPSSLLQIDLSHNQLQQLEFKDFPPEMKKIQLKNNQFKTITIQDIESIQYLNLSDNKLNKIRCANLPALKFLYLKNNSLSENENNNRAPKQLLPFQNLNSIKILNLSQNKFTTFDFGSMGSTIEKLDLSQNSLNQIQCSSQCQKLEVLELKKNNLTEFELFSVMDKLKSLNLSQNNLNEFECISHQNLRILELKRNSLTSFTLQDMSSLEQLDLSYNKLQKQQNLKLQKLTLLKILTLKNNSLKSIKLQHISSLQHLDLSSNKLESSDSLQLIKLTALKILSLKQNNLTLFKLESMPSLQQLDLSGNKLENSESIKLSKLSALKILNLKNNKLISFSLSEISSLQQLELSQNLLTKLSLSKFPALKILKVKKNQLNQIELSDFSNLQELDLSVNHLQSSKSLKLFKLATLKILTLKQNKLTFFELQNMSSLEYLDLNWNNLQGPESFKLKNLDALKILSLKNNGFTSFSLSNMPSLQQLQLSNNKLQKFTCLHLSKLQILKLNFNNFIYFPLQNMSSLEYLSLSCNDLKKIEFSNLVNLQILNLDNNKFDQISFQLMPSLQQLNLSSNPLKTIKCQQLIALQSLHLESNKFTGFHLKEMPISLKSLYLSSNQLKEFSSFQQSKLHTLHLDNNHLKNVKFLKMPDLQSLNLYNNELQDTSIFQKLPTIKIVNLEKNNFTSFSLPEISSLQQLKLSFNSKLTNVKLTLINLTFFKLSDIPFLQELDLSQNQLQKCELFNLPKLNTLNLSFNSFMALQLQNLLSLENLDISYCYLAKFLSKNISALKILNLKSNDLTQFKNSDMPRLEQLDLSENKLQKFQTQKLSSLKILNFENNKFTSLQLSNMPLLEKLTISSNELQKIKLFKLHKLKQLYLSYNKFKQWKQQDLPSLQELQLNANQLTTFQSQNLPAVKIINLEENNFVNFTLKNMPSLQSLNLNCNQYLQKCQFFALLKLQRLYVSKTSLAKFSCFDLPFLQDLDLSSNKLQNFQQFSLKPLKSLKNLDLSSNKFINISLSDIINLQDLKLSNNSLQTCKFKNLNQLKSIDLENNSFKEFNLSDIPNLQSLDLSNNHLTILNCSKLPKLQTLFLRDNQFTSFKPQALPQLKQLFLSSNHLKQFDASSVKALQTLQLDHNNFTYFDLSKMPSSLTQLYLYSNLLKDIKLSELSSLKILHINSNNFTSFKLSNMKNLEQFQLSDNKQLSDFTIDSCPQLKQLSISRTKVSKLKITNLSHLTQLYIRQNSLLSSLQLKELIAIESIYMKSLIPSKLTKIQINNINENGVIIKENTEIKEQLKNKYRDIKFKDEYEDDESNQQGDK